MLRASWLIALRLMMSLHQLATRNCVTYRSNLRDLNEN